MMWRNPSQAFALFGLAVMQFRYSQTACSKSAWAEAAGLLRAAIALKMLLGEQGCCCAAAFNAPKMLALATTIATKNKRTTPSSVYPILKRTFAGIIFDHCKLLTAALPVQLAGTECRNSFE